MQIDALHIVFDTKAFILTVDGEILLSFKGLSSEITYISTRRTDVITN
jgi:hypothetical protein